MTVAIALAESTHHSSRGQKYARAGVWRHELKRDPPTPQPELFSLEEEPSGTRPDRIAAGLPNLDDSAPQMVEQLADVFFFFDTLTPDPEQVVLEVLFCELHVAAMRDKGQDFLGHLCQSQVPVVPESPGVFTPR